MLRLLFVKIFVKLVKFMLLAENEMKCQSNIYDHLHHKKQMIGEYGII